MSHFDISGKDINELHPQNINSILVTLEVFHLDKSGNDFKETQPENIKLIF